MNPIQSARKILLGTEIVLGLRIKIKLMGTTIT